MAGKTREARFHIYKVEVNGEIKLVRTTSRARAIKYALAPIEVSIVDSMELVDLIKQGIDVEEIEKEVGL